MIHEWCVLFSLKLRLLIEQIESSYGRKKKEKTLRKKVMIKLIMNGIAAICLNLASSSKAFLTYLNEC